VLTVGDLEDVTAAYLLALVDGSGDAFKWTASGKAVLFVTAGEESDTQVWYLDSSLSGAAAVLNADDIKLVGTLEAVAGGDLVASNIAIG